MTAMIGPRHHDRLATTCAIATWTGPAVGLDPQQVHRKPHGPVASRSRTQRCPHVATAQTHTSGRAERATASASVVTSITPGGTATSSPQSWPRRIVRRRARCVGAATPMTPSATTPRNARRRPGGLALGSRVSGRPVRPGAARSTSCFIVRTKSPPVSSSSPTTSPGPRRRPTRVRRRRTRRPGGRCSARPPDRSSAARSSLTATIRRQRSPGLGRREPRRRRRLRAAVLVHEHRQHPGERGASSPSNTPPSTHSATSRSDSWKTRDSASPRAVSAQAVGVDVAPPVEHVQDVVELPRQRLAVALDPAGEVDELALQPLDLTGGPHPLAQLGIGLDRRAARRRRGAR